MSYLKNAQNFVAPEEGDILIEFKLNLGKYRLFISHQFKLTRFLVQKLPSQSQRLLLVYKTEKPYTQGNKSNMLNNFITDYKQCLIIKRNSFLISHRHFLSFSIAFAPTGFSSDKLALPCWRKTPIHRVSDRHIRLSSSGKTRASSRFLSKLWNLVLVRRVLC